MLTTLDPCILEENTQVTGHKIRGEAFIDALDWLQLYGGGNTVVGGKNVPNTTAWHLELSVYF